MKCFSCSFLFSLNAPWQRDKIPCHFHSWGLAYGSPWESCPGRSEFYSFPWLCPPQSLVSRTLEASEEKNCSQLEALNKHGRPAVEASRFWGARESSRYRTCWLPTLMDQEPEACAGFFLPTSFSHGLITSCKSFFGFNPPPSPHFSSVPLPTGYLPKSVNPICHRSDTL